MISKPTHDHSKAAPKTAQPAHPQIQRVFVGMGSSDGNSQINREQSFEMGVLLAQNGYHLIYGGGEKGLMGLVAGGYIKTNQVEELKPVACITRAFATMSGELDRAETRIEEKLHDRVAFMIDQAEATVVLPGGLGTLHELATVLAVDDMMRFDGPNEAIQPVILINTNGYYNFGLMQMAKFFAESQINPEKLRCLFVVESPQKAIELLNTLNKRPLITGNDLFQGSAKPKHWPKSFADYLPQWVRKMASVEASMADLGLLEPFVAPASPHGPNRLAPKG